MNTGERNQGEVDATDKMLIQNYYDEYIADTELNDRILALRNELYFKTLTQE